MENIDITRVSSKGQIVIPLGMRKNLKEGDKLIVLKVGDQIILKKTDKLDKNFEEDIEFAKRTEEAWKSYERGEFISMNADDFLEELKRW